jgi:hypothetical protein
MKQAWLCPCIIEEFQSSLIQQADQMVVEDSKRGKKTEFLTMTFSLQVYVGSFLVSGLRWLFQSQGILNKFAANFSKKLTQFNEALNSRT